MAFKNKRIFFIATFLIVAAVAIVLCVSYFTGDPVNEFDGTLVESNIILQQL